MSNLTLKKNKNGVCVAFKTSYRKNLVVMRFFKIFEAEIYFFVYFLHFANMKILLLITLIRILLY
jgi:hypothetical protein